MTTEALTLPISLPEIVEFNLKRYGEYTFIYYEGREITNYQLADQARRLASGLLAQGVKAGDRVLVMMINSPEVLIAYQAITRIGAVIVPLLPLLRAPEIQHIANNCEPKAAIVNLLLAPVMKQGLEAANLADPAVIIALGNPEEVKAAGFVDYSELVSTSEPYTDVPRLNPSDIAVIIYTSGTTGSPKGVMLMHSNLVWNYSSGIDPDYLLGKIEQPMERTLAVLPLAHAFGLAVSTVSYLRGDPLVMLPRFETQRVLEYIEKYQIIKTALVPAMLLALVSYPDVEKYDISSLQFVISGSAPLPESVLNAFEKRFGAVIREGYGLSESTVSVSGHRDGIGIKPGSVGKPNEGLEVLVVDEYDKPLPQGERGEIIVRGPNIMKGYYKNPEATASVIRDGWLHTGDIGYLDEDDYLYIVERKKDLIIRAGQNIYPRDLEEVLSQHPALQEVAVIGIPSEKYGEEVKAYAVLRPGQNVTEEELINYCQQYLARYKTPTQVEFIEALPRNPVGKINKRALRELNK